MDARPRHDETTYLDLTVGRYSLALLARTVLMVQQDVALGPTFELRGLEVPLADLAAVFGGPTRREAPFVVAFEADDRTAAVGVDRVSHLRHRERPLVRRLPGFGLTRPELIEGALGDGGRLLLVLSPAALMALTHDVTRAI